MFDLDNATHTVIEQSNAATNPYFVNTSFPTGTKVSCVGGYAVSLPGDCHVASLLAMT